MCGFAGLIDTRRSTPRQELAETAARMAAGLRHRGPDDVGLWCDVEQGIALGFQRLSIIDLSPAGAQPMTSPGGRFVIAFNGEIYNYMHLRDELERLAAPKFRGHSDTEVMLAAFEQWGVAEAVKRFNGMFAFAVWDRLERRLYLARDRFGEKPLYYGWLGDSFVFGSEIKALRLHPDFDSEIDREALALHLRFNCIPAPYVIYRRARKLPPATILEVTGRDAQPVAYWSMRQAAEQGVAAPFRGTPQEAKQQLNELLLDSVRLRMLADVPLGAFLSGGIDSSTVVALMQAQSRHPVRTFSIGFHDAKFNEAADAHLVARHVGTEHTELYITAQEALAVIPELPKIYDEPFADSSQIPTYLVSALARHQVTVALSGDGGDEVFGGYNRHTWSRRIWQKVGWLPPAIRREMASVMTLLNPGTWDSVFRGLKPVLPRSLDQRLPGLKVHKLAQVLASADQQEMYLGLASHWSQPERVVLDLPSDSLPTASTVAKQWILLPEFEQQAMYMDTITYLVNDILTKLDRASMAVSLEARTPFLDHRVVEFAWTLPIPLKIRGNISKWILRQVLYDYVPQELVDRPKMGFGVPLETWLRGPLRQWADSLLDPQRLQEERFFRPEPIRRMWDEHVAGTRDWQFQLWDVLMFQAWYEESQSAVRPAAVPESLRRALAAND